MAKRKHSQSSFSAEDVKLIRELFLSGLPIAEIAAKFEHHPIEIAETIRCGSKQELRCSFCNRSQHEVLLLIAGNLAYICEMCLDECLQIVKDARPELIQVSVSRG